MPDPRAAVPSVSAVLDRLGDVTLRHDVLVAVVRGVLADRRTQVVANPDPSPGPAGTTGESARPRDLTGGVADEDMAEGVARTVRARITQLLAPPRRAINATGVLLHTGLGRAPLSAATVQAVTAASQAHAVELDDDGSRGHRDRRLAELVGLLTGAQDATFANNGAGALVLALRAVAGGGRVAVARGELIEIGGSFRLPDVVTAAGIELVEIGTTNRTHLRDVAAAVDDGVDAVLVVHPSNYKVEGFTTRPDLAAVVATCHRHDVAVVHDVGSGLLEGSGLPGVADEPPLGRSVAAGVDLVTGSGDKLLGGPQAGLVLGRADAVARARRDPLARALRLDKLRVAGLVATLQAHLADRSDQLPVVAMLGRDPADLRRRADAIVARLVDARLVDAPDGGATQSSGDGIVEVVDTTAMVGGGSVPGARLASAALALPAALADVLRRGDPPVVGRVSDDRCLLDLRTVDPVDDEVLAQAVRVALASAGSPAA